MENWLCVLCGRTKCTWKEITSTQMYECLQVVFCSSVVFCITIVRLFCWFVCLHFMVHPHFFFASQSLPHPPFYGASQVPLLLVSTSSFIAQRTLRAMLAELIASLMPGRWIPCSYSSLNRYYKNKFEWQVSVLKDTRLRILWMTCT